MSTEADEVDPASRWWQTGISDITPGVIRYRGYAIEDLIPGTSFAQMIWLLLRGDLPSPHQAWLMERALVAGVDHGPQAPSIAIARMAATCGVGINNAMASAINVLGDVHGGAGQELMEILQQIVARQIEGEDLAEIVASTLSDIRSAGRFVPGFGHRFHPVDPRRDPLVEAVCQAVDDGEVVGMHLAACLEIERQLSLGRARPIPMNIDGATAIVYSELGFAPELGRGLFVLSRSVGALAHAWEEAGSGLRNKGPIPRPLLPEYIGVAPRGVPGSED
ncbi:citryl-CoA lyase [Nocardioides sp. NBC_00850]|uniref:citryl-CoA lyase n=1 Tax=Nocardioides sp. NBC_00850 TaxID=2976001 RepID=UPI00386C1D7C|nr:citryl-CoA lyase [Nocardioides sp. NBC_00850]